MLSWLKSKTEPAVREAAGASRRAVRERLASDRCSSLLADALERFPEFEPDQAQLMVRDVVENIFLAVMDLGASESYHHAGPWGLADHSIEVAVAALRIARSRHFVGHAAPNPEEETQRLPRLRYGCFLLALYHDLGKLLQAEVRGPQREVHNPFVEPLGAFYDRHGRERCRVKWREGRGLEDHVRLTPYLVGHALPEATATYLGPATLVELLEEKTPGAIEVREIIAEADQQSVREDRRKAEAKAAPAGEPAHAPASFVAYLAKAFAEGLRQSRLAVNVFGGDVLLGRRFAFLGYPSAVLKLLSLVRECFGRGDVAARRLAEDESGARFFLAKLKADEGVFIDPSTGLWKLKATIELGGASDVREGVLIPLAHLGPRAAAGTFAGRITFTRPAGASEVVIDDFRPAPNELKRPAVTQADPPAPPKVEVPVPREPAPAGEPAPPPPQAPENAGAAPSAPPPPAKATVDEPAPPPPLPSPGSVPATLGPPRPRIDSPELMRNLLDGILGGWIPTNVPQAPVYVNPKTTFVTTPAVFIRMRERGLYPEFDPQDRRSAYLKALARLDCVRKGPTNRIVYPILLGPLSERPLKVVKFDTLGLFKSEEIRARVGLWQDWEDIIELPQEWKPGDAVLPDEESDD